jgi:hypothetical protein
MKSFFVLFLSVLFIFSTSCEQKDVKMEKTKSAGITDSQIVQIVDALIKQHGSEKADEIEAGVSQTAKLWQDKDGDFEEFKEFCLQYYTEDPAEKENLFNSFSRNQEILSGYYNRMIFDLKVPLHENTGELNNLDFMYASYDPSVYMFEDMYKSKIAFIIKLNFPFYTLDQKIQIGDKWTRKDRAYAKLGDVFTTRIPGELSQKYSVLSTECDSYIAEYNIYMGKIVDDEFETYFPEDMKLISHWNLRDELKSNYANQENGVLKQDLIYDIMKRIINQDIPADVINSNEYAWNPVTNKIYKDQNEVEFKPENNVRYQYLLDNFKILKEIDEYSPHYPTYIERKFNQEMQMRQEDVEKLFVDFISSPVVKEVGELIKQRLGRELKPYDIWYDGFKARSSLNEQALTDETSELFPNAQAFDDKLPMILGKLNFDKETADYLGDRIEVDGARGAGHAWGAEMKGQKSHLRTRIPDKGMDYKGFNIAMHELGHNVEQTFSLYDVDYYMLNGVPNTAFTEAMAFVFQHRDLKVLGKVNTDPNKEYLYALDNFWSAYEIMGVSVVDMRVWKWLYANPDADAEQLKSTVIRIAKEVWNEFYAPVFGMEDQEILAIYSHMISYPLYLSAYPIGNLIQFQIEEQFKKAGGEKAFPTEVKRMCTIGSILPDYWMLEAVNNKLSGEPLIKAAKEAVDNMK